MNFITLKELKKMVPVASEFKRVPGLKKILEDGIEVILRKQMENHAEVVVYKNGYVSYHAHERYTVFALHNCTHYYYESQGNEHQTIPHNHFEDMEWHIRLVLEGEDRLVRNLEARESETFSYAADVNPEYNNEMEDPRINVMDFVLNADQWKRYEIFQDTLGGRPYLFNGGLPPGGSDGSGTPGIDYQVPAEALTDSEFAAIYKEAQKYVGTPYVWGGSTPETGFDCSGYVCWVYNQNGYNVGRTTANGLWNKSQHISEAEAKPGNLVFFKGTYDTPGMSHTGIYLGNGMMVSAGDPIKYANIHSSYWEKHLAGFGRLSK